MAITYDDYLKHYGVKGMKWGRRKDRSGKPSYIKSAKARYKEDQTRELRSVTVTSKKGETVVATEDRSPKLASFIKSLRKDSVRKSYDSPSFTITVDGKKVGESSFSKKDNGEVNLVWLGINPEHRGKGYASSVFDAAVEYGKSEGASKLTLEVPGNAPDARHIYEKRGFKVTKEPTRDEIKSDFMWGGLTHMALDLKDPALVHSTSDDLELEKAFALTFSKLPKDVEKEVFGPMPDVQHDSLTYEDYLAHYGVKGMKWGRRKSDSSGGDSKSSKKDGKRPTTSQDAKKAKGLQKSVDNKGVGHLSNKELQDVITRMELQQKYDKLSKKGSRVESGKNFIADILSDAAKNVATSYVEDLLKGAASSGAQRARKSYSSRRTDQDTRAISGRRMIGQ